MLNHESRRKKVFAVLLVAGMLAIGVATFAGFATAAGAAALEGPHVPAVASGTGVNAPPVGSVPLMPGVWDAQNYGLLHKAASCQQPPQNSVDRLALVNSPVALATYGLPTLAHEGGNLAKWQRLVSHMQHRGCDDIVYVFDGQPMRNYGFARTNIWGGWGNNRCTNCYNYKLAEIEFYVPSIAKTSNATSDSIWEGVGGANNHDDLSQAGVEEHSVNNVVGYDAFYEWVGPSHCASDEYAHSPNWTPAAGDEMYFSSDVFGDQILEDITTNNYTPTTWGCGASDSVEYIIERNGESKGQPLANYGGVTVFDVDYEDSANQWWGVDQNSGGGQDGFWSWGLCGADGSSHCYLETQSTPYTDYNHLSDWTFAFNTTYGGQ